MTAAQNYAPELLAWRALADLDHAIGTLADLLDRLDRLLSSDVSVPRLRRDLADLAGALDEARDAARHLPPGATWAGVRGAALDDLRRRRGILDQPHCYGSLLGIETEPYPERKSR